MALSYCGCGGNPSSKIENCLTHTYSSSILTIIKAPSVSFSIAIANDITNNCCSDECIDQVGCCTCDDKRRLSCLLVNDVIDITPIISFSTPACEDETYVVEFFVDDEIVDTSIYNFGDIPELYQVTLPSQGTFTFKLKVTNCCGSCEYQKSIYAGYPLVLERVACHTLKFVDNYYFNTGSRAKIVIYDTKLNILDTFLFENYNADTNTNFKVPSDGAYIIKFSIIDIYGLDVYTKSFVLYEFCSVFACYEKAIRDLFCLNSCKESHEIRRKKDQLEMLTTLSMAFMLAVSKDYIKGYGVLYYNSSYLNTLINNKLLLDQLLSLCGTCKTDHIEDNSKLVSSLFMSDCGCN